MSFAVITACPYSATKYTQVLMGKIGLKLGHEKMLENGTVSWQHCHLTQADLIEQGCPDDMVLLHQVRHPLMAISALSAIHAGYSHPRDKVQIWKKFAAQSRHMAIPWGADIKRFGVLGAMNLWYWWNKVGSEKADWTYAVEMLPQQWQWFLCKIGHEPVDMPKVRKTTNRKKTRNILSWNDLHEFDAELTGKLLELAESFGYEQMPTHYLDDEFYNFPEHFGLRVEAKP